MGRQETVLLPDGFSIGVWGIWLALFMEAWK